MYCIICGAKTPGCRCPECGFDLSRCRERYPTLADDGRRPDAIWMIQKTRFQSAVEKRAAAAAEAAPEKPAPAAKPAPEKPVPAAKPAPEQAAPIEKPAPQKTAPAEKPAPKKTAPAEKPAPKKTAPAEKPAPKKTAPAGPAAELKQEKPPKKRKWLLAIPAVGLAALVLILVLTLGKKSADRAQTEPDPGMAATVGSESPAAASENEAVPSSEGASAETEPPSTEPQGPFPASAMTIEKVATLEWAAEFSNSWISYYLPSVKRAGLISPDESVDTGAIYYFTIMENYGYASVTMDVSPITTEPASLNRFGLINSAGKRVIPEQYAGIEVYGRYALVFEATERTTSSDSGFIWSFTADFFTEPAAERQYYKGVWHIFDLQKGALVPGISGTNKPNLSVYGSFFQYDKYDSARNCKATMTKPDGYPVSSDATVLPNGAWVQTTGPTTATVYAGVGTSSPLFTYDPSDYTVSYLSNTFSKWHDGFYLATMQTAKGLRYAVLDETGQIASAVFDVSIYPCGPFIRDVNKYLYRKDGSLISEKPIKILHCTSRGGCFYDEDGLYTFFDAKGDLVTTIQKDYSIFMYATDSYFYARKSASGGYYYYSFRDGDYTIWSTVSILDNGLVISPNNGGTYNLVDTLTGETLLKGYDDYRVSTFDDGRIYIVADYNAKNIHDVYYYHPVDAG